MQVLAAHPPSAAAAPSGGGVLWWVRIACLVYAAFVLFANVEQCLWIMPTPLAAATGSLGVRVNWAVSRDGLMTVDQVRPGGPIAKAGVVVGDRVRFDRSYDYARRFRAGETADLTVVHAGHARRLHVAAQPRSPTWTADTLLSVIYNLATGLAALFGAFIIWRGGRKLTTLLLGMALVTYGLDIIVPQITLSGPAAFPFAAAVGVFNITVIPILFYAFAKRFYHDQVGGTKAWEAPVFWIYALVTLAVGALSGFEVLNATEVLGIGDFAAIDLLLTYLGFAVCLAYLVQGWRRSTAAVQSRYALMLVATSAIILAQALDTLLTGIHVDAVQTFHFLANSLLTGVIASGLFAYCILRHKVFDLGFAVNRTLVYGVVSAILLAAFGLIEWAIDHFVPIRGRENNALIDAAIAVGVFLTFHRVRDLVEHGVEGAFFRQWQKAEAGLRRFTREAAFVRKPATLGRAFAAALSRFANGAEAAVYLTAEDGACRRASGGLSGLGEAIEIDDPALVALRAELRPVEPGDVGSALPAELAAPMLNRNEVIGVVLLGPKPGGVAYRPDERELVGWATLQVGLDMHALRVEALEAEKAQQTQQISLLHAQLEVALAGRQTA